MSSLSCPFEPPDVGNWFSSYEYQSPNLDSNFTLEESSFGKRKSLHIDEEQEGAIREKLVQYNEDLCLTKNMDSCSSCSPFSEPPNIRNWFSSYNYESSAFPIWKRFCSHACKLRNCNTVLVQPSMMRR